MGLLRSELISNSSIFGVVGSNMSIQRGTVDTPYTNWSSISVTINSVDWTKSFVLLSWTADANNSTTNMVAKQMIAPSIVNATSFNIVRDTIADQSSLKVAWEVVTGNIKVQRGTVTTGNAPIAINTVNRNKSIIINYFRMTADTDSARYTHVKNVFNSNTEIALSYGALFTAITQYWQVVEFN